MKFLKNHFPILAILAASAIFFFSRLGRDLLYDWDECIYAAYTAAMKSGSGTVINYFNGERLYDKPPMLMWMLSAATFFQENEFTFRALSAAAGLALLTAVYFFTRKFFSRYTAILATLLLLASESFITRSITVNTDIFFTLFIFMGAWLWLDPKRRGGTAYLGGILLGLGVMVKGLGSLQFLGVLFWVAVLDQKRESLIRYGKLLIGFILAAGPWHLIMLGVDPRGLVNEYFLDNVVKRSAYAIENHRERWYFYFMLIVREFFPWIIFLCLMPVYIFRRLQHVRRWREFSEVWEHYRVYFALHLLAVLPLISITRVATKLSWYALPLMPFFAILIAFYLTVFLKKFSERVIVGKQYSSVQNLIFGIVIFAIAIDAFTVLSKTVQLIRSTRDTPPRYAAIFEAKKYPEKELEFLEPFGERQGHAVLPPNERLAQTFRYGGNSCVVYYSDKKINFEYSAENFVKKMEKQSGLYMVENGDLHFIEHIKNKKKVYENIEYTIFRN